MKKNQREFKEETSRNVNVSSSRGSQIMTPGIILRENRDNAVV